jgi:DNA-binding NtrC family response regulator
MEKLKILFVDDEVKILNGIKRSLREFNHKWDLSFAQGGKEALDLLNQQTYDVIVTDMMMPEMRGEELLSIVRQNFPSVARIVLSGQCNQATAFRLVGSEHLFLSKPCPTDLLISTIENAVLVSQAHVIQSQETNIEINASTSTQRI